MRDTYRPLTPDQFMRVWQRSKHAHPYDPNLDSVWQRSKHAHRYDPNLDSPKPVRVQGRHRDDSP